MLLLKAVVGALFLMPAVGSGQINTVSQQLVQFNQRTVQEKIFVHLDRPLYLVGETVWFKAYCTDASLHRPLDMSKVAYLEVLDKDRNAVLQTKISLEGGKGFGSLFIPPFLQSGHYSVRSYTNWMKNFSPDFYFESAITIVNPFSKPTLTPVSKTIPTYDLQLFPEGGNLVKGLENTIAFRAIGEDGKGIAFRGAVVNQQNDTVARFEPQKFGIGSFPFTPAEGNQYRVLLNDAQKHWFTHAMPPVHEQGYVLQVSDSTSLFLKVNVSARNMEGEVSLLVHSRSVPKFAERSFLKQGKAIFLINKSSLGEGITTITLFDDRLKPVGERLYFKRPTQSLILNGQTNKKQYAPREKMTIDISALQNTAPALADLSLSVYLTDSLPTPEQAWIDSYFGLSSDLKGTVESPAYYFQNTGPEADRALDNLMLTHGWRRFNREEVTQAKARDFAYLPEPVGHLIWGKVVDAKTGTPAKYIDTYLAAPGKRAQLFVATSDSLGRVFYEMKHFFGAKEIIVQTNTQRDSTYRIEISSPYSEKFSSYTLPPFSFDAGWKNALLARSINMQTRNAFLPKSAQQAITNETDTLAFFGIPDEKYLLDAYTRFPTVEEVMREYVPGVAVRKRQGKFIFRVYDQLQSNIPFEEEPLIMLDGVPVFDTDKILAFDPLKIRKLEVIDGKYFLGPVSFSGIVSYTTYKGDLGGFPLDPRATVLSYEGVQPRKEFYAPRYDLAEQQKSRVPDFRNLLYWAPQLLTDVQGKQSISFYTSDQVGTYKVVIQGMTQNGIVGSKSFTFEVRKSSL
ncbi:MAG: hypothetical protein U0X91_24350 [Spirosomataceae bacterium]